MIARLLGWLRGGEDAGSTGDESSDSADADDESGFVGSLLDRSVFVGHGGSTAADRELESVAEEAEQLSETRDR